MFKPTENATIEIQSNSIEIIKHSVSFADKYNMQRVLIEYSEANNYMMELHTLASFYENITIFLKCSKEDFSKIENPEEFEGGFIIRTNQMDGVPDYKCDNVFWEMEVPVEEFINESYYNMEKIVWNIEFKRSKWKEFNEKVEQLIFGYTNGEIMFANILLSVELIKDHPCNVYLCAGEHCHAKHGNMPRYITVKKNGDMYPYMLNCECLHIGNIMKFGDCEYIDYQSSDRKKNFIELNRKLYLEILDKCSYSVIPWFELLNGENYDC